EPGAVERARHPLRSCCAGLADAGYVPVAGRLEIAARPRAVKDDGVATVVDGKRPHYLGERLFFVHGSRPLALRTGRTAGARRNSIRAVAAPGCCALAP